MEGSGRLPYLHPMPSTVIRSFDYDSARNELTIVFTTGRVYVYSRVEAGLVADFKAALSKGEFFNENIRGKFPYRRVMKRGRAVDG